MTTSDDSSIPLKCCIVCKNWFPATPKHFYRDGRREYGLQARCKSCRFKTKPATDLSKKICTRCGLYFPSTAEYFHRHTGRSSGLGSWCKTCARDGRKDRGEYNRKYYSVNREKELRRRKVWQQDNPEKVRDSSLRWYRTNREKVRMYRRQRREKIRAAERLQHQRRRTRKHALPSTLTTQQWQTCLNWFNGCCAYCDSQATFWNVIQQDHFIPLSLGGGYTRDNIVPACSHCNSSKSNKPADEWLKWKYPRKAKAILARIEKYFEWVKSQPKDNTA